MAAMTRMLESKSAARPPFAPPFLKVGKTVIAQTANILFYLGPRLALAPRDEEGRLWTHQLQLTITDLVVEIYDTHHPVTSWLYFEEQIPSAQRRTKDFWRYRVPKFLGYFERVLQKNGGQYLVGRRPDLCRPLAVPDRRGAALRVPEAHEAVREEGAGPDRAARPRGEAPAHQGLPRLGAADSVQPMGDLSVLQGAGWLTLPGRGAAAIRDRRKHSACDDPGSAAHHCASLRAAPRPGNGFRNRRNTLVSRRSRP